MCSRQREEGMSIKQERRSWMCFCSKCPCITSSVMGWSCLLTCESICSRKRKQGSNLTRDRQRDVCKKYVHQNECHDIDLPLHKRTIILESFRCQLCAIGAEVCCVLEEKACKSGQKRHNSMVGVLTFVPSSQNEPVDIMPDNALQF